MLQPRILPTRKLRLEQSLTNIRLYNLIVVGRTIFYEPLHRMLSKFRNLLCPLTRFLELPDIPLPFILHPIYLHLLLPFQSPAKIGNPNLLH